MSRIEACVVIGHEELARAPLTNGYKNRWFKTPDSAGEVGAKITYFNGSGKQIKYITFRCVPYNRVGDIVASEIGDRSSALLEVTGPIKSNHTGTVKFENVWYNRTIESAIIEEIFVQYMDGSEETLRKGEFIIYGSKGSASGNTFLKIITFIFGLLLFAVFDIWGILACAIAEGIYFIIKRKKIADSNT
ncbi:MAG: hypothetical protein IJT07_03770 [Oscillospiraceae bacterium]|nr:hypothetical protein [Oscillospiraceae bacterium]